ncbi:MAG: Asp-tRNA(Asn)/Glu-tRNA(Gln) amidotransferase subunit GatC [Legionellales bacterium]|nr:Asp-tRNA(Asn)/Glu-tRNA(Gln) amidotransferase subunit GatC [Legionellales bacterium]
MSIDNTTLQHMAHLARLSLDSDVVEKYIEQFNNILNLVSELDTINTDHVEPMTHPLDLSQRLRADIITESDQHATFLALAPEITDSLFLVPEVIEEGK